jgi:hypothetical protein
MNYKKKSLGSFILIFRCETKFKNSGLIKIYVFIKLKLLAKICFLNKILNATV